MDDLILESPRLRLRDPDEADAPALQLIAADERVARTTASLPHPYPADGAAEFIAGTRANAGPVRRNLAIILRSTGAFIGMISFVGASGVAELRYMVSPEHWDHGYATEAVARLIAYLAADTPFRTITASVMIANPASEAVLRKAGFHRLHVAEVDLPLRGTRAPISFWRLDVAEASRSKSHAAGNSGE